MPDNNIKRADSGASTGQCSSEAYDNSCAKSGTSIVLLDVLVRASASLNEMPKAPKGEAAGKKAYPE